MVREYSQLATVGVSVGNPLLLLTQCYSQVSAAGAVLQMVLAAIAALVAESSSRTREGMALDCLSQQQQHLQKHHCLSEAAEGV